MERIPGTICPAKALATIIAISFSGFAKAEGIQIGIEPPDICLDYFVNSTPATDTELTTTLDEAFYDYQNRTSCLNAPALITISDSLSGQVVNSDITGIYLSSGDHLYITGNEDNPPILESMGATGEGQQFFHVSESAVLTLSNLILNASNVESAQDSVPLIVDSSTLILENLKIQGFYTSASGGALSTNNSTISIIDSIFQNNRSAADGGAIYSTGSNVSIDRSLFIENHTSDIYPGIKSGGAIAFDAETTDNVLKITNSEFRWNHSYGLGGAIDHSGPSSSVTITDNLFLSNQTTSPYSQATSSRIAGGAISLDGLSPADLSRNNFTYNSASADGPVINPAQGGAIFIDNNSDAPIKIHDNWFEGNQVSLESGNIMAQGGAAYIEGSTESILTFKRNAIIYNRSAASGGGLYINQRNISAELINNTFAGNRSESGGGGLLLNGVTADKIKVAHNTFRWNRSTSGAADLELRMAEGNLLLLSHNVFTDSIATSSPTSDTYSLCNINSTAGLALEYTFVDSAADHPNCATIIDGGGNQIGTTEDPLDAGLDDLGLYRGGSPIFLPKASSVLVDAGDANIEGAPDTDQRGKARVFNGVIDLGAVERGNEVAPVVTVQGSGSGGGGTPGAAFLGLFALLGLRRKK